MVILPLIFLLLGFVSAAHSETCPDADVIAPCSCEDHKDIELITVSCSNEDLNLDSLKKVLKGLVGKNPVDLFLDGFTLGTLPSTIFEGIGITILEIRCNLDSLTDGGPALSGLEDTLEDLRIGYSFTEDNVPASLKLPHLRRLRVLDLMYNVITELSNDWFEKGQQDLEYLVIANNGIEKLGDRAFETLNNLRELSFTDNRVGSLKRSMFPREPKQLEKLELDNNALTSIPDDLFTRMPVLDTVSLRDNGILRLDQRTWEPVWNTLKSVMLEGNPLECDSQLDWTINTMNTPNITGKCETPPEVAGKDLGEFILNKRSNNNN